ncbi:MAG: hypothetical protein JSU70_22810 [Phycisphaerales bacterium]|nr:MAG: hypothetical protein JSU70_22810 [Phycisphaerales bacterium]
MNMPKKAAIWLIVVVQTFGICSLLAAKRDEADADAPQACGVRDYEAAKTTPQPIDLWKVKKYGCGGNPRTARELRKMETYGHPLELICPLIDGAAKYVAQIKGVRGCAEIRSFESDTNFFHLEESDLPPGRYQWDASAYTAGGEWLGDVEVIEPVEIFCVVYSAPPAQSGQQVLLDLGHTAGHIRGWGYYNHAQYMIKELLELAGFQVRVNQKNLLSPETLDGVDLLIMHYYWVGWPGFKAYLESELSAIREFVAYGGSLLVVGCDRSDGGGNMVQAGNQLVERFGLQFVLVDAPRGLKRARVVDEQGIISFANPVSIQLPAGVDGQGHSLLVLDAIPVAAATGYGDGRLIVAGLGMSFLDCYLGDYEHREPFHLLLFYDFVRYLTDVDWTVYCESEFVDRVFDRCPGLQLRE